MNKPIEQNLRSIAEPTDSQNQTVILSHRASTLAKADLKVGSKAVVDAYTIHARPKNRPTPIQADVAISESIRKLGLAT